MTPWIFIAALVVLACWFSAAVLTVYLAMRACDAICRTQKAAEYWLVED